MIRRTRRLMTAQGAERLRRELVAFNARSNRWMLELKIEARLQAACPWSDRWWYELGQLNVVRRQRIALDAPLPLG